MLCKRDICKKIRIKKRYICLFDDTSPEAKDPVHPCALVCMTLFGNVYFHVPKRVGDTYQCNETDTNSGYFLCPVAQLIRIMQNHVFSIILIHEVNQVYNFIIFAS